MGTCRLMSLSLPPATLDDNPITRSQAFNPARRCFAGSKELALRGYDTVAKEEARSSPCHQEHETSEVAKAVPKT